LNSGYLNPERSFLYTANQEKNLPTETCQTGRLETGVNWGRTKVERRQIGHELKNKVYFTADSYLGFAGSIIGRSGVSSMKWVLLNVAMASTSALFRISMINASYECPPTAE